ncbi:hypothetical protein C8K63_11590 [Pseudomonas sp. GV085]|nr:hypothetical protein C8K63_11590 [Pseudomonas sp. GV085]
MSQTGRDYGEKRDYIRMRVCADKKGGLLMAAFFSLPVEIKNRLQPYRLSP